MQQMHRIAHQRIAHLKTAHQRTVLLKIVLVMQQIVNSVCYVSLWRNAIGFLHTLFLYGTCTLLHAINKLVYKDECCGAHCGEV